MRGLSLSLLTAGALISFTIGGAPALAENGGFKQGVDADGNNSLSLDEFVMAMATRDYGRFDVNKDDRLTVAEWTAVGGSFQTLTEERFNTNGDDEMAADELVEVYSWIFGNRDANNDGQLERSETPQFLLTPQA